LTIDFTNSSSNKQVLTDEDIKLKIAQIKENRERRKQGLPPLKKLSDQEQEQKVPEEIEEEEEQQPPKLSTKPIPGSTTNNYAYFQQQIQNQLSYFQAEKFSQVAQAARKEKHIIYKFAEKPQPPKLGEKPTRKNLIPIDVYYNELPNEIHYKLDEMRAKVANLQYVKSLQTPTVDQDGNMNPAALTQNDSDRTGVNNKIFASISTEIDNLNKKLAEMMAYWYYGIDKDLLPQLENTSLANALEAGLYREIYGLVNTSKNSAIC
jgi:hypothetical protein